MRAMFVIHNPGFGGGYNEILQQRSGLEAAGWELTLTTCEGPNSGADRLEAAGLEVVRMPLHRLRATRNVNTYIQLATRFAPEVRTLQRLFRERGADVVQVHGEANFHAAIAGRRERIGVCWHLYDLNAPRMLRRVTTPSIVRLAGSVTVVGEATAAEYPGLAGIGGRLVLTFPPVDAHRFRPDADVRLEARAELAIAEGTVAVGTVGARNPAKGHDVLIEAAAALLPRHPETRIFVLGEASPGHPHHEAALRAAISSHGLEDRINLIDPGTRVAELLPALDLFVMPSRREAMPTAILEAMACELPVVATDVAAVREEVLAGETGLLVPPEDVRALADATERLIADEDLRRRMGRAGRVRAAELFTPERAVANRLRAWDIALSAAGRR